MKLYRFLQQLWASRPPTTWTEVFATIGTLLLGFLAVAYFLDWLQGVIP